MIYIRVVVVKYVSVEGVTHTRTHTFHLSMQNTHVCTYAYMCMHVCVCVCLRVALTRAIIWRCILMIISRTLFMCDNMCVRVV